MWKKIDSPEIIEDLTIGKILTNNPDGSGKQYEIKGISDGLIKAVHSDGIIALKILTEKELLSGNWYVKKLE
jgi:hypothetical protein